MTRTHFAQKVAGFKNIAVRTLAVAALAGAALAAAPAAQAQRVYFGFGGPRVVVAAPPVVVYGRPGFYGPDWRAREVWREREFREHRDFYGHDGWRDHRGFDRR